MHLREVFFIALCGMLAVSEDHPYILKQLRIEN
jgi:hypothetical protein